MSAVTERVSDYIRDRGISIKKISADTGVSYVALYDSLGNKNRKRELRDEEFLKVCIFLGVDPISFADRKDDG